MRVPNTSKRKALIIIDLQPAFIKPHNEHILKNIIQLINNVPYNLYIEAVFHAEKGSLWDEQQNWTCPQGPDTHTVKEITDILKKYSSIKILKDTRSVFKGDPDLEKYLKEHNIEELHLVGTETNDCVFATALEAFDNGYPVYVIEECCESATEGRHGPAVQLLRYQGMTNNSCLDKTVDV